MTLQELRHLAQAGVKIEIGAADLLGVLEELSQPKPMQSHTPLFVPLGEAVRQYGKSPKTLLKYVRDGIVRGELMGGRWQIEDRLARDKRIHGGATV